MSSNRWIQVMLLWWAFHNVYGMAPHDTDPSLHQRTFHQSALTMPDAQFQTTASVIRASSMVMVQNGLSRMVVGAQLGYNLAEKPHYEKTFVNSLKDRYGGGGIRTANLLFHNLLATQFLEHGQYMSPWLFGIAVGSYGALCTPFEALVTHKTNSLCQWRAGKRESPLSYVSIVKQNGRSLFRGSAINGFIYGTSWPLFLHYINCVKDVDFGVHSLEHPLHWYETVAHSAMWGGIETIFLNPLYVLQRRMQQDPQVHTKIGRTLVTLAQQEGLKAFYRGSTSFFTAVFFSTLVDFLFLQYSWAREEAKRR